MKKYKYSYENADFKLMIYVMADSSEKAIKYKEAILVKFLETPAERSIDIGEKYDKGSTLNMRLWAINDIKQAKPIISYQDPSDLNVWEQMIDIWELMLSKTNVMLAYSNKHIKFTDVFCLNKDHIDREHIYSFWKKPVLDTAGTSAAPSLNGISPI